MNQVLRYTFIEKLKTLPFVDEIWLFGSRARGDNQERADIDLAILCPLATQKDWRLLQDIIENADTLLKIDCVRLDRLGEASPLKKSIAREGVKLYAKS